MSLLAGLSLLSATGCQTPVEPEVKEAAAVVARLRSHRLEVKGEGTKQPRFVLPPAGGVRVERAEGGLTVKPEKATRGDSRRPARVVLPEVAQRPFQVKDLHSGMTLEVALEGARAAKAEVVDGYVVYPDAHAEGADVVHRFTPEGTEDYLSFERAPSVPEVRYGLKLGTGAAGLRLVGDTLEVLDGSGAPRLRMAPPYLVGADGHVTQAHVAVEGCAVDTRASAPWERPVTAPGSRQCRVRVGWNAEAVKYPAVLDPMWSTTGSLVTERKAFTTTVLPDGRVLAAGGDNYAAVWSSAELYDPATGTWATTGSLVMTRTGHSAHLLGSGKVLLVGGDWAGTSAELYDPATGTWSSAASMATGRRSHRTVLLHDGRVLAIGGSDTSFVRLASAELYDPATHTWAPTGSLSVPRDAHGAVLLADGKVLVFGGTDMGAESTSELYDPTTGTWTPGGALSFGRSNPLGERLPDGRVLMFGGSTTQAEVYDPATNTWSLTSATTVRRQDATSTLLPGGRVLAVGAMGDTSSLQSVMTELYDPLTGTWSLGADLQTGRVMHSTSLLWDGRVLVVGGKRPERSFSVLASAELLLPNVNDVTAPTVTVTSPTEGTSIEGEVLVTASAADDHVVQRVEFFAGETLIGTDTTAPFSVSCCSRWDVPNGSQALTARAYDAAGNVGTSAPVSILVDNDVTPPTVTVTSPAADSVVQGLLSLSAEVSDDRSGVREVEFWDGRSRLGVDTEAPYAMSWDLSSVPGGPRTVTVTAYDMIGNRRTISIPFTVNQPGTATYDSTFRVPRCATVGPVCDSGSYLTGRGTLLPELNQPNTLQGSCADGTAGWYDGQRIDRIRISSMNGSPLEAGKRANVEVRVAPSVNYTSEAVDLHSAADATNPVWTYLTTLYPPNYETQTFSTSFVLPVGGVQALRARYRNGITRTPCGSGAYDDHDDLVFAVSADVTAPTVSLTAPAAGATVKGTTTLTASASDSVGVSRVEFFDGASLLGTDATAPYSLPWNTVGLANGGHSLTARAYDALGNMGTSASVSVTVDNDTTAPTVSLTSPLAGATLFIGNAYLLNVSTSDNVGVTRVEFYDGANLLGTDTAAPYALSWNTTGVAIGGHSLTARAYDAVGNMGTSASVSVTVQPDTTAPTVSLTLPAAGATLFIGTTYGLNVSASDNVGVTRVEFYDGASLLGTDTTAPYLYAWNTTGVSSGGHSLTARAYDAVGNVGTSASVSVTVEQDTTAPAVSLTSPAPNATLFTETTYSLTATASDNVGVTRVEFFLDGTPLGSDTIAPYSLNWYNTATVGNHSLLTKAYDAAGNVTASTDVAVSVQNPVPASSGTLTYSASNTDSARVNTSSQVLVVTAGQVLTLGTCGVTGSSFSGNTYLRLYNPSGTLVAFSDDACGGSGSNFTYSVLAGAGGNYQFHAGCYSNLTCSGTVAWTIR